MTSHVSHESPCIVVRIRSQDKHMVSAQRITALLILGHALLGSLAQAEERSVFVVRVPMPIESNVDARVKASIERIVARADDGRERKTLLLEFWPVSEAEAASSSFERSLALARYLTSPATSRLRTVAYLPRGAQGHAVLPVLACEQIVMHPDAELGDASRIDRDPSVMIRAAYRDIASRNRTVPEAVALGMLDPELKVVQLTTANGNRFALEEEVDAIQKETVVTAMDTVVDKGNPGLFAGRDLRLSYRIVNHLATDRRELAGILGVALAELEPDPSVGANWNAIQLELRGTITDQSVQRVQRTIEDEVYRGQRNFICLVIDSPGGSMEASLRLGGYLAALDSSQVRTVALIENEALGDAAVVAIACDHIVMRSGSRLGGPGTQQPSDATLADAIISLQQICDEKKRRWSLPVALIDPDIVVYKYTRNEGDVVERFSEAELAEQTEPQRWQRGDEVKSAGELLSLDAKAAKQLGIARHEIANFAELKQLYGLESDPDRIEPGWADQLISDLARPHIAFTLLFFAGIALMVEISSPGVGLGGFVAVVCFVLFFWSKYLDGTANWLEMILFVTGLIFILLEVFVIPGLGIFGVGGAALILASLVLASQTFIIPRNAYQMNQLPYSLLTIAAAGGGVVAGIVALRRFLETAPVLNRMVLPESQQGQDREVIVDYDHLLGATGTTLTRLMPAGKVRIGDQIVQVVTDGMPVEPGHQVKVVEVLGNRVIVRSLEEI